MCTIEAKMINAFKIGIEKIEEDICLKSDPMCLDILGLKFKRAITLDLTLA